MTNPLEEIRSALEPFANSLVAQMDVTHPPQDWREETDDTVVSIKTSHQRKGMPELSPDSTLWVGAFRRARRALALLDGMLAVDERALLAAHEQAFTAGPLTLDVCRAAITAYLSALKDPAQ